MDLPGAVTFSFVLAVLARPPFKPPPQGAFFSHGVDPLNFEACALPSAASSTLAPTRRRLPTLAGSSPRRLVRLGQCEVNPGQLIRPERSAAVQGRRQMGRQTNLIELKGVFVSTGRLSEYRFTAEGLKNKRSWEAREAST